MLKLHYTIGLAYVAVCTALVTPPHPHRDHDPPPRIRPVPVAAPASGSPAEWFARMKPNCNAVEVETTYPRSPAPAGAEGAGYGAACFALAGKIDRARAMLNDLPAPERYRAAGVVFEVAHPVADAGDDRSAGPIMALVVEFWPNHYMALYHAGASEAALGQPELARTHLTKFLELYTAQDGWRTSAIRTLKQLGANLPAEREDAR